MYLERTKIGPKETSCIWFLWGMQVTSGRFTGVSGAARNKYLDSDKPLPDKTITVQPRASGAPPPHWEESGLHPCAIAGYVPSDMVKCLAAFMDFCNTVRRNSITTDAFANLKAQLARLHEDRVVFINCGVRDEISLPRQHSLVHYIPSIILFGSSNGLCSSITESKHIKAVKEPWRRSSWYNALAQMLIILTRLDKLAALRTTLKLRGMLSGRASSYPAQSLTETNPNSLRLSLILKRTKMMTTARFMVHSQSSLRHRTGAYTITWISPPTYRAGHSHPPVPTLPPPWSVPARGATQGPRPLPNIRGPNRRRPPYARVPIIKVTM
ncbi:hypothetical protein C8F04DRAFT_1396392 [Mycena alexandri]|uniref:Uncharacterized protein n=1 Tax=Mycena alexandri TaxID=1745969 RepID=A0AAD6SS66_9AGAR|nr:hypothetical protein C8F04DRAFT_1396392 [Mycena alexandri]